MKKVSKLFSLLLIFFLLSCEESVVEECESCEIKETGTVNLSIEDFDASYKYWDGDESSVANTHTFYQNTDNFNEIRNVLSSEYDIKFDEKNIFSIVLFHDELLDKNTISHSKILGCQIYYTKGKNIITNVYENIGNQMTLIPDLNSNVAALSVHEFFSVSNIFKYSKKNIVMYVDSKNGPTFRGKNGDLLEKLKKYDKTGQVSTRSSDCFGTLCQFQYDDATCDFVFDPPGPGYYNCRRHYFTCFMEDNPTPNSEVENRIAREFRDLHLSETNIGRKYIDYYYTLSSFARNFNNDNINALNDIRPLVFQKVLQYMNNSDVVLIDNNTKVLVNNILEDLRNENNSSEFLLMLTDVQSDIEQYANKTVSQIKLEIN